MSCLHIQNSLSAHLDGYLPEEEKRQVLSHLASCSNCTQWFQQLMGVRGALSGLPDRVPPAHLTARLRVAASRERARLIARRSPFGSLRDRTRLWLDNLMRPLALPLAGGLASAMLLFGALLPTMALRADYLSNDNLQVGFITEPYVKAQTPLGFEDDFLLEIVVDGQGRMVDYAMVGGPTLPQNSQLRRQIENYLLFTQFTPGTMFGMPKVGKMYLSISRNQVTVKS